MKGTFHVAWVVCVIASAAAQVYAAPATAPAATNPMAWHEPAVMPAIADPLTDAQYEQRRGHLTLPEIAAKGDPAPRRTSVVVQEVLPHSQALEQNVKAGDDLAAIDGEPLHYDWEFSDRRKPAEQQLQIISADGKSRTIKMPPGRFGVTLRTRWNAAAAWAASPAHDPRFDAFIRVAAAALHHDPELCQSALSRAQRAGCDGRTGGYVPPAIAGELAYQQFHFSDAVDMESLAIKDMPDIDKRLFCHHLRDLALGSGTLKLALDIADKLPELAYDEDTIRSIHKAIDLDRAAGSPVEPDPLAAIDTVKFRDASAQLISLLTGNDDTTDSTGAAKTLRDSGKLEMTAPPNEYRLLFFGPTGQNIDATFDFTFNAWPVAPGDQDPSFTFGLFDSRDKDFPVLKVSLFGYLGVGVQRYGTMDYEVDMPHPTDGHWHARIVVIGRQCEVLLNDHCVFTGPLIQEEKDRKLGLLIQPVGVHATIHDYTWRIAGERPAVKP